MNLSDADKQKLKDALSVKASLSGNMMNFIGLDEIRDRFPDMWERHRDRIVETSKAILKQFTDPRADIVLPVGEANFVVLFTRLDKGEAMLRAAAIKAEILRRFVGDDVLSGLDIHTQAMDLESGEMTAGVLGDLLSMASTAEPTRRGAARPAGATGPGAKSTQQRVYRASIGELGAGSPVSVDTIEQRFGFNLDDLEFAFLPYLYVKRGVFSIFECHAARYSAIGDILTGYGVLPREPKIDQIIALDEMTLMRARHGLVDMAVRKRVAVVAVPVAFETMTNRASATEYIALLEKIPSDLRNYLVVDVCRCPGGVPEGRLAEIVNPLKRLTRAVLVRITSPKQSLGAIKGAGAFGVGFAVPPKAAGELGSPVFIGRFAALARKLGLQSFVSDVDTQDLVDQCREAGLDYLAGRALAELSDYVGPVTEYQGR